VSGSLVPVLLFIQAASGVASIYVRRATTAKLLFAASLVGFCMTSVLLQTKFATYSDLSARENLEQLAFLLTAFSSSTPFIRWTRYRREANLARGVEVLFFLLLFAVAYSFIGVGALSPFISVPSLAIVAFGLFAGKELLTGSQ
jgi:hypothetical protein